MTNISLNLKCPFVFSKLLMNNYYHLQPSRIIPDTIIVQYTFNKACIQRINPLKAKRNRTNCCLYHQSSAVYFFICAPSICKKEGKNNRKGSWICDVLNQFVIHDKLYNMTWVSLFGNVNMLSSKLISMMM